MINVGRLANSVVIDPNSSDWTEEERGIGCLILKKMGATQQAGKWLPGDVFEARYCNVGPGVSTNVTYIEKDTGRILLIQRPTLQENPNESYPGQWYVSCVTHGNHDPLDTGVELNAGRKDVGAFEEVQYVGYRWVHDPPRIPFALFCYIATITGDDIQNPKAKLFSWDDIPWDNMVGSHREKILTLIKSYLVERGLPPFNRA